MKYWRRRRHFTSKTAIGFFVFDFDLIARGSILEYPLIWLYEFTVSISRVHSSCFAVDRRPTRVLNELSLSICAAF